MQKLVRQTLYLSGIHFIVRAMGFLMRLWLSRELGTLAMGVVELAQSAQMLLITPVVSGLPAAMSRVCARQSAQDCRRVLRMGVALSLIVSLPLCAGAFIFREAIALWLGDLRTLPALIIYLPCLPILGVSAALNGYFYGRGKPLPPALSELLEQAVRFWLCLRLVKLLRGLPLMLTAAIPAAATLAGETAGLLLMLLPAAGALFAGGSSGGQSRRALLGELVSLSLPITGMRMVSSLMRTVSSVLLPRRLAVSGLPAAEALSRLGVMQGMLMPMLMLPSFISCSLSSVAAPELSRRQAQGLPLSGVIRKSMSAALVIGLGAMAAVWLGAPVIAGTLYRRVELLGMLRRCCALVPLMALTHVCGGVMNGLGLQAASLRISIASGLISVLLTYILCAMPLLRIYGAMIAVGAAQAATLLLSLRQVKKALSPEYTSR